MDSFGNWIDQTCVDNLMSCDGSDTTILEINEPARQKWSWNSHITDASGDSYCYGWDDTQLSNEYTSSELVEKISSDLNAAAYSDWVAGYPSASFHLTAPYKKCGSASKFEARILFTAPDGISLTVNYTLRTNHNGVFSYGYFTGSATALGGGQYRLDVPEVVPPEPEMDIDLIDITSSFEVTLTKDKSIIYGKSTAPVSCDLTTDTSLTITANAPVECVDLVIESVEPLTGNIPVFVPPSNGTLQYSGNNTWTYTSWTEPESEKYARSMRVKIKPLNPITGEQSGPSIQFTVKSAYEHMKDQQNWPCAYEFIRWRYAAVLATTEAEFNSVSFDNNETVSCAGVAADACTSVFNNVTFAAGTFNDTENHAASTVGHELVHTGEHFSECPSYTWEVDHATGTGLNSSDNASNLQEVTAMMNAKCN
jgi:hypothetical protein